jgi:hypothetical protein
MPPRNLASDNGVYVGRHAHDRGLHGRSHHNSAPKPFVWTKNADDILAAIERFCTRTLAVQNATNF